MTAPETPERLSDGAEFGAALRELAREELPADRLEKNRAAVHARLAALPALAIFAWLKGGTKLVTFVKLFTLTAATGAAVVGVHAIVVARAHVKAMPAPVERTVAPAVVVDGVPAETAVPPRVAEAAPAPAAVHHKSVAKPAPGELEDQLRLFKQARTALGRGAYDDALGALDALQKRFPDSPLAPEASLTRAECLSRAGRTEQAVALLRQLLGDERLAERRGELHLMLGQLWLRSGRCDLAAPELETALASRLPPAGAEAARGSLAQCDARKP